MYVRVHFYNSVLRINSSVSPVKLQWEMFCVHVTAANYHSVSSWRSCSLMKKCLFYFEDLLHLIHGQNAFKQCIHYFCVAILSMPVCNVPQQMTVMLFTLVCYNKPDRQKRTNHFNFSTLQSTSCFDDI